MNIKDHLNATFWDKKASIGAMSAEGIFGKRPDYRKRDVLLIRWDDTVQQIVSIDEIRNEHPVQTKGMNKGQVKDWFVKHRIAAKTQQMEAVEFRETGYMEAMAEMEAQILDLKKRIETLENK